MPIIAVGFAGLLLAAIGVFVGGGAGALGAHLLLLRGFRARERQGVEVRPEEEFSSGCGALLLGFLAGSLIGCGALCGLAYLVVRFGE